MSIRRMPWLLVILLALAAGFWAGNALDRISAQDRHHANRLLNRKTVRVDSRARF